MKMTDFGQLLLRFVDCLVNGEFDAASGFLSTSEKGVCSPDSLAKSFREMFGGQQVDIIEIRIENILKDWEGKLDSDIGWAYCSIISSSYDEGISAVITREGNEMKLRDIEWGRP